MSNYRVSWSETLHYCVEVEADNMDDAAELAHGKVYDDEDKVVAYDCDMSDDYIKELSGLEVPCMSHYPDFDHYCHEKAQGCQLKEAKEEK